MALKCSGHGSKLSVAEKQKGHECECTRGRNDGEAKSADYAGALLSAITSRDSKRAGIKCVSFPKCEKGLFLQPWRSVAQWQMGSQVSLRLPHLVPLPDPMLTPSKPDSSPAAASAPPTPRAVPACNAVGDRLRPPLNPVTCAVPGAHARIPVPRALSSLCQAVSSFSVMLAIHSQDWGAV